MDLQLKDKLFVVCGATSGFGFSTYQRLIAEKAKVIAVARGKERLSNLFKSNPRYTETLCGDITQDTTIHDLLEKIGSRPLSGVLVNASGPPAKSFAETDIADWDQAYHQLLRWKVELTKQLLPKFDQQKYGRFLYIESSSVKQPFENLVLSTSLRLAVVGLIKTLSQEIPDKGITFNVLAPGYHYTPASERLIVKKVESSDLSFQEARGLIEQNIPMKKMGDVDKFASLAAWLLSPLSEYITGQVFAVDGGVVKSTL